MDDNEDREKKLGLEDVLEDVEDTSLEEILSQLLDERNLELKTDIPNALELSRFSTYGKWLEAHGLEKSSDLIDMFINDYFLRYKVSENRGSRNEIIDAIKGRMSFVSEQEPIENERKRFRRR